MTSYKAVYRFMNRKCLLVKLKYARSLLDFILDVFCIAFFVAFSYKIMHAQTY